jgi:peptide/nickel transport system substrate-binding protein
MRRELVFLRLALLTCLALAGCGGPGDAPVEPAASGAARENVVRAWMGADPASLSLIGKMDHNAELLAVQITDSLVQYDPQLVLRPRVAEAWEFSEDRRTLTFHLRDDVRWHDGTPVTAEDVVFTVRTVTDPATENRSYGGPLRDVLSIEALDRRTVRVRYEQVTPDVLEHWRVPLIPKHVAGADEDLLTGEFARHPVGCGPFRFASYRPGQEIVLEANDDYWDGPPHVDRLLFKVYPEQQTAYQALLTGGLDVMKVSPALWFEARQSDSSARLEWFVYSRPAVWPVVWNQDGSNPFFTDRRVRQALMHALDRNAFIETVAHGQARPGATSYHPDTIWADPEIEPRAYDPELAARLLDEAGWTDSDGDGTRDRDGAPFRFTLLTPNSTMQLVKQIAVWQQHSWAQIGVRAEVERLEWQAFRERRNAGDFEAASFSLTFSPNPDQFDLYHSTARETGFNFYGMDHREIDRTLEQARETFDTDERRRIYRRLQHLLFEEEPIGCTFYFSSPVLHDRNLTGIVPTPLGIWHTTEGPRVWRWSDAGPSGD